MLYDGNNKCGTINKEDITSLTAALKSVLLNDTTESGEEIDVEIINKCYLNYTMILRVNLLMVLSGTYANK